MGTAVAFSRLPLGKCNSTRISHLVKTTPAMLGLTAESDIVVLASCAIAPCPVLSFL